MEQVIVFVATEDASTQLSNVKREVIAYLGVRMIKDDFMAKGVPMIGLEEKLADKDKDAIAKIVLQYSEDIATLILHEKKEVGSLDPDRKLLEFIQYEEPTIL